MKIFKFGAVWCKECLVMKPMWQAIEAEMPGLITEYYDADEHPEVLEKHGVKDVPMFIFFDKDGKEFLRLQGIQNKEDLIQSIKHNFDR